MEVKIIIIWNLFSSGETLLLREGTSLRISRNRFSLSFLQVNLVEETYLALTPQASTSTRNWEESEGLPAITSCSKRVGAT